MNGKYNELLWTKNNFQRASNLNFPFLFAKKVQRSDNKINLYFYSLNFLKSITSTMK